MDEIVHVPVMDIRAYNRLAWDKQVNGGNPWTIPVSPAAIEAARQGQWAIILTPSRPVPRAWFPDLSGLEVLCLASGGGQQGPILAAAGARVTVLDNSPKQLAQDRLVAERDGLEIHSVEGDMADLSIFPDQSFDLIVHPVSNLFVPDVRRVWAEAYRVLCPGGQLFAGFNNPAIYLFDRELWERGILQVKHKLPYSDLDSLSAEERQRYIDAGDPLEFSHTLEDQIGGQIDAGFVITGFYEDAYGEEDKDLLTEYMPTFIVTRAVRPKAQWIAQHGGSVHLSLCQRRGGAITTTARGAIPALPTADQVDKFLRQGAATSDDSGIER
jgi:SAM-dependent methyltransferase